MKKLFILLIAIVLLTGCVQNSKQDNITDKTENLEVASDDKTPDLFERNLKCLGLREEVEARIAKNQIKYYDSLGEEASFESIFYSPTIESCLYVVDKRFSGDGLYKTHKRLFDVLNDGGSSYPLESCLEALDSTPDKKWSDFYTEADITGCSNFQEMVDSYK